MVSTDVKEKKNIVIWHDALNNTISRLDSNNFHALSASELIVTLKGLQSKLSALVYCHCYRSPYILDALDVLETDHDMKVFIIVTGFISLKKKDSELLKKYNALH